MAWRRCWRDCARRQVTDGTLMRFACLLVLSVVQLRPLVPRLWWGWLYYLGLVLPLQFLDLLSLLPIRAECRILVVPPRRNHKRRTTIRRRVSWCLLCAPGAGISVFLSLALQHSTWDNTHSGKGSSQGALSFQRNVCTQLPLFMPMNGSLDVTSKIRTSEGASTSTIYVEALFVATWALFSSTCFIF